MGVRFYADASITGGGSMKWLIILAFSIWGVCEVQEQPPIGFWEVPVIETQKPVDPPAVKPVRPQVQERASKPMRGLFFRRQR